MKLEALLELADKMFDRGMNSGTVTLYHGTCRNKAIILDQSGFDANTLTDVNELVLVSTDSMAQRQANADDCDAILTVINVSIGSIMPEIFNPFINPNSRQDMVDAINAGEEVTVRLVKSHRQFRYINKFRKRQIK